MRSGQIAAQGTTSSFDTFGTLLADSTVFQTTIYSNRLQLVNWHEIEHVLSNKIYKSDFIATTRYILLFLMVGARNKHLKLFQNSRIHLYYYPPRLLVVKYSSLLSTNFLIFCYHNHNHNLPSALIHLEKYHISL